MIRKLVPILVFAALAGVSALIMLNRPEARRAAVPTAPLVQVETRILETQPYQVRLQSYGIVRPRTQSTLLPQVSGPITEVSPNFRDGGFFEAGEILLHIDSRDYEAAVATARAGLAQQRQALLEEQAQAEQALQDWRRWAIPKHRRRWYRASRS
ncbi:hypothetical protein [Marinobacterium aestuariivivens]|uniref:Membrane fusion protein biotin-lipoyl like domain-containing protein n=1 Tax=Marinobacterium aestuariivivens TaxID=1698799 RepID=A0ABW1ZZB7_9GAMM